MPPTPDASPASTADAPAQADGSGPVGLDAPGRGQRLVDGLVRLLDLEKIEEDIFRGRSPQISLQRVFGGQVAGQALVAAGRTVEADRAAHSLHSYFIRGGDPAVPIVYTVDRIRDGRSFSVRRVVAIQHGQPIFILSASFQVAQAGLEHATTMSAVPLPEELPTLQERLKEFPHDGGRSALPIPFEVRYVDDPPWAHMGAKESQRIWMRASGTLVDDPLVHVCALTFASDLTLLEAAMVRHGLAFAVDRVVAASLDHAMWFHRPFRADEWFLYESTSPSASGSRGLGAGQIFARDGRHLVTVMQEGLIRIPDA